MNNSTNDEQSFSREAPNYGMETLRKLSPIAVFIILTNGLVFFLFHKRKGLRTSSNIFLLGLAACDFLTGAINIPYFIAFNFGVVPKTSPMYSDFAHWLFILHTLVAISAAYHILFITAEKYMAVVQPLKHYLVTKKTVCKVLAAIWLVSSFIATIELAWRAEESELYSVVHKAICLVIVFLVPYVFMIYAYTVMFRAVSGRNKPSELFRNRRRLQRKNRNDRKCILIFSVMAVIYLCCWLPYFTLIFIFSLKVFTNSSDFTGVDRAAEPIATSRYITSVINPLLYTFFKRDFWLALRGLFVSKRKATSTIRHYSLTYVSLLRRSRLSRKDSGSVADSTKATRFEESPEIPCTESEGVKKYTVHITSV